MAGCIKFILQSTMTAVEKFGLTISLKLQKNLNERLIQTFQKNHRYVTVIR